MVQPCSEHAIITTGLLIRDGERLEFSEQKLAPRRLRSSDDDIVAPGCFECRLIATTLPATAGFKATRFSLP
jgi:hypothetical protein